MHNACIHYDNTVEEKDDDTISLKITGCKTVSQARANKEMNKTENLQKLCYKSQWTCERRISLKTVGTQYTHAS